MVKSTTDRFYTPKLNNSGDKSLFELNNDILLLENNHKKGRKIEEPAKNKKDLRKLSKQELNNFFERNINKPKQIKE